jgi:hypothetical protein
MATSHKTILQRPKENRHALFNGSGIFTSEARTMVPVNLATSTGL